MTNEYLSKEEKEELKRRILVLERLIKQETNKNNILRLKRQLQQTKIELRGFNTKLLDLLINKPPVAERYPDKEKEHVPEEIRKKVLERDHYECQICYSTDNLIVHHILPKGSADLDNLVTLCRSCHSIVHQFLRKKGYRFWYIYAYVGGGRD